MQNQFSDPGRVLSWFCFFLKKVFMLFLWGVQHTKRKLLNKAIRLHLEKHNDMIGEK